jgi:elongator complex protein 1
MQQRILDDLSDLTEQMEKQVSRLADLKRKCDQNPYNYYCIDDPAAALENVELAPDGMSDAGTAFTRYTVAPTTLASSTKQSSCVSLSLLSLSSRASS